MSGFDTSQPIADEAALENVDVTEVNTEQKQKPSEDAAEADELGDATPGPR
jgi:hypothetical protein